MSQPSMDIGSIAIVEDEPVLRRLMRLWLETDGYTVIEYNSGQEATKADAGGTAIVCLDLQLGDSLGESVLADLLARDPDLPVIVVTGDQDLETAGKAMRAGAYDFVTKPFDRERLGQAVRRAMERRKLTTDLRRLQQQLGERTAQAPSADEAATRARDDEDSDLANLSGTIESAPPPPNMPEGIEDRSKANDIAIGGSTLNLREIERVAITQALKLAGGSVGKAAKILGIGRATLYRRLSEQRGPIGNDDGRPQEHRSLGSDAPPPRQSELRVNSPEVASNKLNGHAART